MLTNHSHAEQTFQKIGHNIETGLHHAADEARETLHNVQSQAKKVIDAAEDQAKKVIESAEDQARAAVSTAKKRLAPVDKWVHTTASEHPYAFIGATVGTGFLAGFLTRRRAAVGAGMALGFLTGCYFISRAQTHKKGW
jgi:ElaB/YqjD/DUF883 family membrane-anchored ribosome-binding protein